MGNPYLAAIEIKGVNSFSGMFTLLASSLFGAQRARSAGGLITADDLRGRPAIGTPSGTQATRSSS